MKSVLEQLNGVPDVIGSMVCDGSIPRAFLFPPLFDEQIIRRASDTLVNAGLWMGHHAPFDGALDLRYADGRIIVRTLKQGFVLVLCARTVNLSLLNISLNVACKRLDELMAVLPTAPPEHPPAPSPSADVADSPQILTVDELDSRTEAGKGFQELGMVAVNAATAQRLSALFSLHPLKRVRLTHTASGLSGVFGMMVFPDDSARYDGTIIISRHVEKKLSAVPGDRLRVEPA